MILKADPAVQHVVDAAERSEMNILRVSYLLDSMAKQKTIAATAHHSLLACRDVDMHPVWRALTAKLDTTVAETAKCYQCFIGEQMDPEEASNRIRGFCSAAWNIYSNMQELQQCTAKAAYDLKRAAQALQGSRQSPLEHRCWTLAAIYMQKVAQMYKAKIVAAEELDVNANEQQQKAIPHSLCILSADFVHIAENVLGSAAEYLDKARGAEAGVKNGRDPTEAPMWRRAAELRVKEAELKCDELTERENDYHSSYTPSSLKYSAAVKDLEESVTSSYHAAEHFYMAFKYRTLPDVNEKDMRVAVLYEHTAEIMSFQPDLCDPIFGAKVIAQHQALIRVLNTSEEVEEVTIAPLELACSYGALACTALHPTIGLYWRKANELLSDALALGTSMEQSFRGSVAATLYAFAARAEELLDRHCYAAAAAHAVEKDVETGQMSTKQIQYQAMLARVVLVLGSVASSLPPEIVTYFEEVLQGSAADAELRYVVEEHAAYIMLRYRCTTGIQKSSPGIV